MKTIRKVLPRRHISRSYLHKQMQKELVWYTGVWGIAEKNWKRIDIETNSKNDCSCNVCASLSKYLQKNLKNIENISRLLTSYKK